MAFETMFLGTKKDATSRTCFHSYNTNVPDEALKLFMEALNYEPNCDEFEDENEGCGDVIRYERNDFIDAAARVHKACVAKGVDPAEDPVAKKVLGLFEKAVGFMDENDRGYIDIGYF